MLKMLENRSSFWGRRITCLILSDVAVLEDEQNAKVEDRRNGAPVEKVVDAKHVR